MSTITLIIAVPDMGLRRKIATDLCAAPMVQIISETRDLMATYTEVEEKTPMAVVISGQLAREPEFEVMRALFSALDVRWLVISDQTGGGWRDQESPWERNSDLFPISGSISGAELIERLQTVTRRSRRHGAASGAVSPARQTITNPAPPAEMADSGAFILIGASTGGVDALISVLSCFPPDCPPTFIVQHTGGGFGESLTRLLDRQCAAEVRAARDGDRIGRGQIALAAGSRAHMRLGGGRPMRITLLAGTPISGHMPSVDAMFQSAVPGASRAVAALLTGMGRDGARGLKALHDAGACTIAQDEATSTVYGMPRAAMELDAARQCLPLQKIGPEILRACAAIPPRATQRRATT
ncbi:CheB methylesterase domain-containing protein [Salipiger aestuarii]|uniref:CheB methylesterase domain-containing protein n=1 Tax=Salipiger aestuarii TaxID=568098 RepID=UPI00123B9A63|nr:CheB methylesterase domain-containing protein [Salipiger aestuarii]KAA8611043.1 chemotaxis protein [Salipiger aestuarii]